MMTRLVIASAASFETDDIISSLTGIPYDITRIVTGVGITQSAMIAANTRDLVEGRHVIFCCTGGMIGSFKDVEIFCAKSLELAPWDVRHRKTELLDQFDGTIHLTTRNFDLPSCRLVCGLGVSVAEEVTRNSARDVVLESIEAYSVARAWVGRALSLSVLVATTNATGKDAREQWKRNFASAAKMTAICLHKELRTIKL